MDKLSEQLARERVIRERAVALIHRNGWTYKERPGWHSIIQLMTAFGLDLTQPEATCAYPDCGCDFDAICAERVAALPKGEK